MRLSDAIAMGQGLVGKWEVGDIRHCALGMACNAIGMSHWLEGDGDYVAIRSNWPWTEQYVQHPFREEDWKEYEALELIYTLFDEKVMTGGMTLNRLIDWVRSVEPPEETATESCPVQIEQAVSA